MKDIDKLAPKSRKLRDAAERIGSSGLAFTGLVGLLFLGILVWQITAPTIIAGEKGVIQPASDAIPISDYEMKWDYPNIDDEGGLLTDPIIIEISWDGGDEVHELTVNVIDEKGVSENINITEDGISTELVVIGKKTKILS